MALKPNFKITVLMLIYLVQVQLVIVSKLILSEESFIPEHVYQIQMPLGSSINGQISSSNPDDDYSAFIYPAGVDVLSNNSFIQSFGSYIVFNSTTTNIYYLRIQQNNFNLTANYSRYQLMLTRIINIFNSSYMNYYYFNGVTNKEYPYYKILRIQKKQSQNCISDFSIRYRPPMGIQTQLIVHTPSPTNSQIVYNISVANSYLQVIQYNINNISQAGEWTIRVKYNTSQAYYNPPFYTIQFFMIADIDKCNDMCDSIKKTWRYSSFQCKDIQQQYQYQDNINKQKASSSNIGAGIIIGSIVGGVLIMSLFILLVFMYKRRQSARVQEVQQIVITISKIQPTQMDMSQEAIQTKINQCSICLSSDCDAMLECKHFFHLECIMEWVKRNNSCPFCRKETTSIKKITK